jgi:hypothetical protein
MSDFSNLNDGSGAPGSIYRRKTIDTIQQDDDAVTLVGHARNMNPSFEFTLDDGTGKLSVRNIPDDFCPLQEGRLYKVLGMLSIDGAGMHYLDARFVEDVTGLNLEYYKQAIKLMEKNP